MRRDQPAVQHDHPAVRPSLAARKAALLLELAAVEEQQRHELLVAIVTTVGVEVMFTSRHLWAHQSMSPALRQTLAELEIADRRALGQWLRQMCGQGIERIGRDERGIMWAVSRDVLAEGR